MISCFVYLLLKEMLLDDVAIGGNFYTECYCFNVVQFIIADVLCGIGTVSL